MHALVFWALIAAPPAPAADPLEIVRKSVNRDQSNWQRAKDYTYIVRSTVSEKDSAGKIKKVEQETTEVTILYGEPYRRLVEKDGKPLSPDDQKKEQRKLDKLSARRASETPAERLKRVQSFERDRQKERDFARELPEAFNFTLVGEELVNGRKAWVLDATPRPGYQPQNPRASMLKKFKGRMWIDQQEYQWVRLDGEAIDTVSWGLFLARLAKGSRIRFEQVRVNDEVWMPKMVQVDLDARLALFKHLQGNIDLQFANFRKFQSDSRVLETAELK